MAKQAQKRLFFRISQELEKDISNGIYKVGQKIPTEKELSETYNVSRIVIREAILALEVKGYVEARAGSGVVVTNMPSHQVFFEDQEIGPFELLQARQIFEREAAALAATQITKRGLIQLQNILEDNQKILQEPNRNNKLYLQDEEFHLIIARSSNNLAVASTINHLWQLRSQNFLWNKFTKRLENTIEDYKQAQKDHEKIFDALSTGSSAASYVAMHEHLNNIQKILLELTKTEKSRFDADFFNEKLPVIWP